MPIAQIKDSFDGLVLLTSEPSEISIVSENSIACQAIIKNVFLKILDEAVILMISNKNELKKYYCIFHIYVLFLKVNYHLNSFLFLY